MTFKKWFDQLEQTDDFIRLFLVSSTFDYKSKLPDLYKVATKDHALIEHVSKLHPETQPLYASVSAVVSGMPLFVHRLYPSPITKQSVMVVPLRVPDEELYMRTYDEGDVAPISLDDAALQMATSPGPEKNRKKLTNGPPFFYNPYVNFVSFDNPSSDRYWYLSLYFELKNESI